VSKRQREARDPTRRWRKWTRLMKKRMRMSTSTITSSNCTRLQRKAKVRLWCCLPQSQSTIRKMRRLQSVVRSSAAARELEGSLERIALAPPSRFWGRGIA